MTSAKNGRAVREDVLLFDVIPGPPQAEPGIQRLGSNGLLRALFVRAAQALAVAPVWIPARRCAPSGMTSKRKGAPFGMMSAKKGRAIRDDIKEKGCAVRDDVSKERTGRPE